MTPGTVRIAFGLTITLVGIATLLENVPHPPRLLAVAAVTIGVALLSWGTVSRRRFKQH